MQLDARGLTTLECLVALVVFCLGVLGAAGTTALAVRAQSEGTRLGTAARLAAATFDRLRGQVRAANGACVAVPPGGVNGDQGVSLTWDLLPVPGGQLVRLVLLHPVPGTSRSDTVRGFIGCR